MKEAFLTVLLCWIAEAQGAWVTTSPPWAATKRSVRLSSQRGSNDAWSLSGQVLPQGILGVFREPAVNKSPWKGSGAVGFREPDAIREMTVFHKLPPSLEEAKKESLMLSPSREIPKQNYDSKDEVIIEQVPPVVSETKKDPSPVKSNEIRLQSADAKENKAPVERGSLFQRTDPGFMVADVMSSVRINSPQYLLSSSPEVASMELSNRKARDAAILRFESSSWSSVNLKSEKASADVLKKVNIGTGPLTLKAAPVVPQSSALAFNQESARVDGRSKEAQIWSSGNVKPTKDSADVLTKVQLYDESKNTPLPPRVPTNLSTAPDQPDVLGVVKINRGNNVQKPNVVAKPTKDSADVLTHVKIHADTKPVVAAKSSNDSADVLDSVKVYKGNNGKNPSAVAKPAKDSADVQIRIQEATMSTDGSADVGAADVLNSVRINEDPDPESVLKPPSGSADVARKVEGDKADIVKPFDKSNTQSPIEPILVDEPPKVDYKNDLDDIINIELQDESSTTASSNDDEGIKDTPTVTNNSANGKRVNKNMTRTSKESVNLRQSVEAQEAIKPPPNPISRDAPDSVKAKEDIKPAQLATNAANIRDDMTPAEAGNTSSIKSSQPSIANKNEQIEAEPSISTTSTNKNGSKNENPNGKSSKDSISTPTMEARVNGTQNKFMKETVGSLVAADVLSAVKLHGDRLLPSKTTGSTSSSNSKWKSDFDPNRWAPMTIS